MTKANKAERWLSCFGAEGYQVSDRGNVRGKRGELLSLRRRLPGKRKVGYVTVKLSVPGPEQILRIGGLVVTAKICSCCSGADPIYYVHCDGEIVSMARCSWRVRPQSWPDEELNAWQQDAWALARRDLEAGNRSDPIAWSHPEQGSAPPIATDTSMPVLTPLPLPTITPLTTPAATPISTPQQGEQGSLFEMNGEARGLSRVQYPVRKKG